MAMSNPITIRATDSLSADELAQVRQLQAVCERAEGLELKLDYGMGADTTVGYATAFLALSGGAVVGFCSLDGDANDAELCGMVHPDHRRRRVGIRLFEAARASFIRAGGQQLFAICEDASASGRVFLRMLAGQRAFSEHRMVWSGAMPVSTAPESADAGAFTVELARPEDLRPLAVALASAFSQSAERLLADLTSAATMETERVYVARRGGEIIGGFRLSALPDSTGIYAFGIDARYQRQGWGRRMLAWACALAQAQGAARVTLEVDTDNAPAIALYSANGFKTVTTYGYYIFSPTLLVVGLDLDESGQWKTDEQDETGDD